MKSVLLRDFFKISTSERKGIFTLCLVFSLLFIFRVSMPLIFQDEIPPPNLSVYFADQVADINIGNRSTGSEFKKNQRSYTPKDSPSKQRSKFRIKTHAIEINLADSAALDSLKGVSAYFAAKIIRYRERLGGFYSLDQLDSIYHKRESDEQDWLTIIKQQLTCNPSLIRKFELSLENQKRIFSHPLIGYQRAKILVNYIRQHGTIRTLDQLIKTKQFTEDELKVLARYIIERNN